MKKLAKLLTLVLIISVFASISVSANNSTPEFSSPTQSDIEYISSVDLAIEPRYIPCSGGGYHEMVIKGNGVLQQNGEQIIPFAYTTQCRKCYDAIVSEFSGHIHGYLGRYGYYNPGYDLLGQGIILNIDYEPYENWDLRTEEFFRSYTWV